MAVIVDLDDETPVDQSSTNASSFPSVKPLHHSLVASASGSERKTALEAVRPNPNINGFSAALSCYPIASQLASQLDLNTLHDLSRTCRQFRANLLEYRDQLVKNSLHCEMDDLEPGTTLPWREASTSGRQLTSGRISRCARDMVNECRRCGTVVCRNCTIKPPKQSALQARHRRLCRTCSKAPLQLLTNPQRSPTTVGTSSPPGSPKTGPAFIDAGSPPAFTAPAFERTPCSCDPMVWLCQPCGQHLRNTDTMYIRAWTWRTRYSHYLGGVGTGAGEGNEGVNCGRGSGCLSAKIVEQETNCNAETLAKLEGSSGSPERWTGTSYRAQEIEGIGGVFKMKTKNYVPVGETVKIYEDERDQSIQYLKREVAGKLRSWCSWCERVIAGERDTKEAVGARPGSSGSSSTSSST
ncbi:hypothetical protein K504DRAFT_460991 [Pleomassaria siparia CBS 279.74]|uniref:Uncharacterized protein n=1 Tax=Pleomassaria siparia CBS 279.74 TaxID=1314801 RepID=A0A6G1JW55_9PLEO|nr:hypothetical protein K504DRAFT_460991 [Pleomassaria siparia CBS 279.74]